MAKNLLLTFFFLSFLFVANAQDYKVVSVETLQFDMSARKQIKTDDNDQQCALLRIATQNIAPEKKEGFHFSSDYGSQVVAHSIMVVGRPAKPLPVVTDRYKEEKVHRNRW